VLGELLEAGHLCDFDSLPMLVARHAAAVDLHDLRIYLADRQQIVLRVLPLIPDEVLGEEPLLIDGTLAGRAFRDVELVGPHRTAAEAAAGEPYRFWVPILDGTDRLGVLEVRSPRLGEDVTRRLRALAALVGLLIVSKRSHSDSYARVTRTRRMSLAAEVQWQLLPPLAFANDRVAVGAAIEPAYEVGGDAFSYALSGRSFYLSIFDAMGHDTAAGLTASIAIGSWRSHRRLGLGLAAISNEIGRDVVEQFDGERYVTGILSHLDLDTGELTWVNRGHPPPLIIRGGRWIDTLETEPSLPMGLILPERPREYRRRLEPGDRLLLYTDGIPEAREPSGALFGMERFASFVIRHEADGLSAPETLRRLMQDIMRYQNGKLQDDAAVLLAEWRADTSAMMF
jgi:serine phosphatase RsbU (regulator of sigma subunit)